SRTPVRRGAAADQRGAARRGGLTGPPDRAGRGPVLRPRWPEPVTSGPVRGPRGAVGAARRVPEERDPHRPDAPAGRGILHAGVRTAVDESPIVSVLGVFVSGEKAASGGM